MTFELSERQQQWRERGAALGASLAGTEGAAGIVAAAGRVGLLEPQDDLLAAVVALDAFAAEHASAAMALALHLACALTVNEELDLSSGARVGALTLSTEQVPAERDGRLSGRASWVAPFTPDGVALVAARRGDELTACVVDLGAPRLTFEPVDAAGLSGLVIGHLTLDATPARVLGATMPAMWRARVLISAVGLGIARRAVRESLRSARGTSDGAGGEQTTQGLVADAATDLDAAMLLTWKAATGQPSLGAASLAKLAATVAAQRAVERATQVVGAESFRTGHVIERLTQDVRALELFAGRTEALREAVAVEQL
jgi:alkylation response protein AidB-like acyl-CoA dehydrogenase